MTEEVLPRLAISLRRAICELRVCCNLCCISSTRSNSTTAYHLKKAWWQPAVSSALEIAAAVMSWSSRECSSLPCLRFCQVSVSTKIADREASSLEAT